ncbi:MAG: SRPBCC family protein [bacterium]|nr:SRPBCC family protein [bacterium]
MKFTCVVEIDLPVETVIELYDSPENLKKWQDGFVSIEHLSGSPGEPGAKSKLIYTIGKRTIELIETIIKKDLPREFSALYEAETMVNTMKNQFTSPDPNRTIFDMEIEYTKFNGVIPKMMSFFMPGIFKKQTQKWLNQFKTFAEEEGSKQQA